MSKNSAVDSCSTCSHPFIRCFVNFDVLPLIEFRPHNSISCQEALDLIVKCPPDESVSSALFNDSINSILSNTEVLHYVPVEVDQRTLESFNREEIYAIRTSSSNDIRFYKNMIPEIGIAVCQNCGKFFHEEDYEYKFLKYDGCPYCKTSANENVSHSSNNNMFSLSHTNISLLCSTVTLTPQNSIMWLHLFSDFSHTQCIMLL